MRYLENSYDKTKLKIDEASHLKRIYEDIKRKLEVVSQAHHRLEWSSNENVGIGIILHCIKLFLSGNDNKDMMGMIINGDDIYSGSRKLPQYPGLYGGGDPQHQIRA